MGQEGTHIVILHANEAFSQSLKKVLDCFGFNCVVIESQYRKKIIESGQKQIFKNIARSRTAVLLLDIDPSVDAVVSYTPQDLVGWILQKRLHVPIVLIGSQQNTTLGCPTCDSELPMVPYPNIELSRLLEAIHKASEMKALPQHSCRGISFYNSKRHILRMGTFVRKLIHTEILRAVPKIIGVFVDNREFCENLWCELYGELLNNMSKVFDTFHFDYEQIVTKDARDKLIKYSQKVERMILSDQQSNIGIRLEEYIDGTIETLRKQIFKIQLDQKKNSSVLDHYDTSEALHIGRTFNEKVVLSTLKAKLAQLQAHFKSVSQSHKVYWQCRAEIEMLLITLDIAPAFYFLDEVKNAVRKVINQQTKMLRTNFRDLAKNMIELEKYYKRSIELLREKLKFALEDAPLNLR